MFLSSGRCASSGCSISNGGCSDEPQRELGKGLETTDRWLQQELTQCRHLSCLLLVPRELQSNKTYLQSLYEKKHRSAITNLFADVLCMECRNIILLSITPQLKCLLFDFNVANLIYRPLTRRQTSHGQGCLWFFWSICYFCICRSVQMDNIYSHSIPEKNLEFQGLSWES